MGRSLRNFRTTSGLVAYRLDRSVKYVPSTDGNGYFNSTDRTLKEEQVAELEAMDSVKDVHFHTLSGGYSPSFEPALGVRNGVQKSDTFYN